MTYLRGHHLQERRKPLVPLDSNQFETKKITEKCKLQEFQHCLDHEKNHVFVEKSCNDVKKLKQEDVGDLILMEEVKITLSKTIIIL